MASKVLKTSQLSEKETSYKIDIGSVQRIIDKYRESMVDRLRIVSEKKKNSSSTQGAESPTGS